MADKCLPEKSATVSPYCPANDAVSIDRSIIRGNGSEFLMECTTVVVIIFAAGTREKT